MRSTLVHAGRCMVVGPGGVGKSSVARAVAASFHPPDRVVWVDVEPLRDAQAMLEAVFRQTGIELLPGENAAHALAGLEKSRTLVVLDGVEHLVDAVEQLVADWPGSTCGPWLLATSRRVSPGPLMQPMVRLRPLPLDGLGSPAAAMILDEVVVRGGDGTTLLAERELFLQVLAATGGLPVAIALTADHIARFGLRLAAEQPVPIEGIVARCIDRTLTLLTDDDRRLFRRLGLTAGTFTVDVLAAAAVAESLDAARASAGRLIDHGLLFTTNGRFDLLPPIRDGALALLHQHGDFDTALGEMAAWLVGARNTPAVAANLDTSLSLAWTSLHSANSRSLAYPVVSVLFSPIYERLRQRELLTLLEALLADDSVDARTRVEAARRAALCAAECDTMAHARKWLDSSLTLARELDDTQALAKAWSIEAWMALDVGDHSKAIAAAERSMAAARADESMVLVSMRCRAEAALATGDLDRAEELAMAVLERADAPDSPDSMIARTTLGWCLVERGRRPEAVAHARHLAQDVRRRSTGSPTASAEQDVETSETAVESELIALAADPRIEPVAPSLDNDRRFAWWMRLQQRIRLAARLSIEDHWEEVMHTAADVLVIADLVPLAYPRICALNLLGDAALEGNDLRQAGRAYEQAMRDAARSHYRLRGADAFDGVAGLALRMGKNQLAGSAAAAAVRIRESAGATPWLRPSLPQPVSTPGRLPEGWLRHDLPTAAAIDAVALALREPTGTSRWDHLTHAERHVARLVREGMSNNEIAGALFISRRTVESHLARTFRKLDIRSRTQLATLPDADRL